MFSRKDQLLRKTGPDGIGRYDYLRLLKKEFNETISQEAKQQILANLANFAYDPINYDYIRSLDIISLFLNEVLSDDNDLCKFAAAALCNISADPTNCQLIIRKANFQSINKLLTHSDEGIVLNILSLYYFIRKTAPIGQSNQIFTEDWLSQIRNLKETSNSFRVCNLITVLLEQQDVATNV